MKVFFPLFFIFWLFCSVFALSAPFWTFLLLLLAARSQIYRHCLCRGQKGLSCHQKIIPKLLSNTLDKSIRNLRILVAVLRSPTRNMVILGAPWNVWSSVAWNSSSRNTFNELSAQGMGFLVTRLVIRNDIAEKGFSMVESKH